MDVLLLLNSCVVVLDYDDRHSIPRHILVMSPCMSVVK